jgi:O-acetylhomoserine/O-acetylserine sulfhydrylase-like pyridoxal-dependent enzyme
MFGHHDNGAMCACADVRHRRASRAIGEIMKSETIAIHCGYEPEPMTNAVAMSIHQTVARAFDSAEQGAALFKLDTEQAALDYAVLNVTERGRNVVSVPRLYGMMVAKSLMTVPESSE